MDPENGRSGLATVIVVALGTFMSSFDSNAVNMALPLIQRSFGSSVATVEWVAVAYLLAVSATLLSFGRLADMWGHKKLYVAGFAGFTVTSLLSALSPSIEALVIFRIMQGLCASLMMASSNALIIGAVPSSQRGKALGATAVAVALATCAGPALGGLIATAYGWKSIFFINLPIGVVGTILAARTIQRDDRHAATRFDPLGSILVAVALVSALLSLDLLSAGMSGSPIVWVLLAAGAVLIAVFALFEGRSRHPLLDMHLFQNRVFTAGNMAAVLFYLSLFILVFMAPYFLQGLRGFSPSMSGILMLPMSLTLMIVAPISGALSDRFDSRWFSCGGMIVLALGETLLGSFTSSTPVWLIVVAFAVIGLGMGFFQTPNNSAVMGSVPAGLRGVGGAILATMRNLGMVLGEAVSAALLASCMASRGLQLAVTAGSSTPLWGGAFSFAIRVTCGVAGIAAVGAGLLSLARGRAMATGSGR